MKTLALWPFCSQQDKTTGTFLLDSDVTCLFMRNLSRCWDGPVVTIVPHNTSGAMPGELRRVRTPTDNMERRRYFNEDEALKALRNCDIVVVNNELAAANLRPHYTGKIVHFNHLMPIGAHSWMKEQQIKSWRVADLVIFLTDRLSSFARGLESTIKSTVWPMAISDDIQPPQRAVFDCVFPQRCSDTNYTHHVEFLRVAEARPHLKFAMTDPTRNLKRWPANVHRCESLQRQEYLKLLASSKVVVGLMEDDLHGGVAVREAMASGCQPVFLDQPCYADFEGERVSRPIDCSALADAIDRARQKPHYTMTQELFSDCKEKIRCELASM